MSLIINSFPECSISPPDPSLIDTHLLAVFRYVCALHTLPNKVGPPLEKIGELSLSGNLMIKNQDEILEEKGEIIMTERVSLSHPQTDEALSKLYPERKPYYQLFHRVTIRQKPYHVLIQAGFLKSSKLRKLNTLPRLDNVVLKNEKLIIHPVFDDIMKRVFFLAEYLCLN